MTALIEAVQDERDRTLVERHQAGDPAAFAELYERHYGRLTRLCRRLVRDSHLAEEIAQDAFLRAYTAMDRLEGERRFYPWLTVIARRLAIDHIRRDGRVQPRADIDAGHSGAAEDVVVQRFDGDQVRSAMDRVRGRHREVLRLRDWEGLSYDAIAERLGVPSTAVPPLLHRARAALRREYILLTEERVAALLHLPALAGFLRRARDRVMLWASWLPDAGTVSAPALGAVLGIAALAGPSAAPPAQPRPAAHLEGPAALGAPAGRDDTAHQPDRTVSPVTAPTEPRHGGGLDPAASEHVVVPDVASVTINDRERTQRSRDEQRGHPIFIEMGPVGFAMDPEEDRRHFEEMVERPVG